MQEELKMLYPGNIVWKTGPDGWEYGSCLQRRRAPGSLEYLVFPMLEQTGIVDHFSSTRIGGASRGVWAETDFSYALGDDKACVDENYRLAAKILGRGRTIDDFVLTHQTHTANVLAVTEEDRGKGVTRERDYENVDGLVTNVPGLVLTVLHADCTPVYLVDPVNRAIGLVHSGWKGTVAGIAANAMRIMGEKYGSRPEQILSAIGPSICGDCYEVGEELEEAFLERFPQETLEEYRVFKPGLPGKRYLDMWNANRMVLEAAGVLPEHISVTNLCTRCNPDYLFSYRIHGLKRGNMASFLSIRPAGGES